MTRHSLELCRWPSASSHHKDGRYSPSTKQSDISRLLDPAYLPSTSHASSSYSSNGSSLGSPSRTEVYVDHRGDLHDPDYRHFPAFPNSSPTKPKRRPSQGQRVPAWERGSPRAAVYDLDDDSDDEAEAHEYTSHSRPLTPVARVTRSTSNPPRVRTNYYAYYPDGGAAFHSAPATKTAFTGSLLLAPASAPAAGVPTPSALSLVDEPVQVDAVEDAPEAPANPSRLLRRKSKKERARKEDISAPLAEKPHAEEEDEHEDAIPSCVDALRVQFQTLSLRLRFGIFRARRRVRRKMAGG